MTEDIGDAVFTAGMLADAQNLGDTGSTSASRFEPYRIPEFKKQMDGMILVAGDGHRTVDQQIQHINTIFSVGGSSASIDMVLKLSGDVRPGAESGREQYPSPRRNKIFVANMTLSFGFNDGISQPAETKAKSPKTPSDSFKLGKLKYVSGRLVTAAAPYHILDWALVTFSNRRDADTLVVETILRKT
ncbi:hypothetical protein KCU99_g7402, partial [Aureobasidium melanogenum]